MRTTRTIIIAALLALGFAAGASAQNSDNKDRTKVITLDKDFVPVEKKAVKKNNLPTVKKSPVTTVTAPTFSTWTRPTVVPSLVPTMEPYGYRTLHHFSEQNGYLTVGAGTQLNMNASAGYRIIDEDSTRLGIWLHHSSTWNGKNLSPLVPEDSRQKQKYNDNTLGLDLLKTFTLGTLEASARGEFDSFNYYGGWTQYLIDNKQSFYNLSLDAKWNGSASISGSDIDYRLWLGGGVAGYGKSHLQSPDKGSQEAQLRFGLGGEYNLGDFNKVGLELGATIVNLKRYDAFYETLQNLSDTYGLVTVNPYYKTQGENYRATLGMNLDLSMSDGARLRLSPNAKVEYDAAEIAKIYASATGGKELNTLARMHSINRYSSPRERYCSTYTPLDLEAGVKIGPFKGLSLRLFGGYGIYNGVLDAFLPISYADPSLDYAAADEPAVETEPMIAPVKGTPLYASDVRYAVTHYRALKYRGAKVGVELNYKYRSLAELSALLIYCPSSDGNKAIDITKYQKGYSLNYYDGTSTVAQIDLKVTPTSALTITAGLEYRGNRGVLTQDYAGSAGGNEYFYSDLDDIWNLKAGVSYRFAQPFTVWVEASNLLNRHWDEYPGMSAQKLNIMGGISINF